MKVLVTGATGQLGHDLILTAPPGIVIPACDGRHSLDIRSSMDVENRVRHDKPDIIINAAAYTAVDKAESEPHLAFAVNADGAANLARAARLCGSLFIHISTDYVFAGDKSAPYLPDDPVNPISVYGRSKAEGERLVMNIYPEHTIILRTAWMYSGHGKNFVKTVIRSLSECDQLRIVSDQTGTPTWSRNLAEIIWVGIARQIPAGIYHWTDGGSTNWYEFACAIVAEARAAGLVKKDVNVVPITTEEYPVSAQRPPYSVLDSGMLMKLLNAQPIDWRESLHRFFGVLTQNTFSAGT